jgi:hypothetical protein
MIKLKYEISRSPQILYLCDYGLARDGANDHDINEPPETNCRFRGTAAYASLNTQEGVRNRCTYASLNTQEGVRRKSRFYGQSTYT